MRSNNSIYSLENKDEKNFSSLKDKDYLALLIAYAEGKGEFAQERASLRLTVRMWL